MNELLGAELYRVITNTMVNAGMLWEWKIILIVCRELAMAKLIPF